MEDEEGKNSWVNLWLVLFILPSRRVPRECLHSLGKYQGGALWKFTLENAVQPVGQAAEPSPRTNCREQVPVKFVAFSLQKVFYRCVDWKTKERDWGCNRGQIRKERVVKILKSWEK